MDKMTEIQLVAALRLAYQQGAKDCLDLAYEAMQRGELGQDSDAYYKNRIRDSENAFIAKTMRGAN